MEDRASTEERSAGEDPGTRDDAREEDGEQSSREHSTIISRYDDDDDDENDHHPSEQDPSAAEDPSGGDGGSGGAAVAAGLVAIFAVGAAIGLVMPKDGTLPTPWYRTVSACVGWIYFACWSVSFYPQAISNFRRGTTRGLSPEFCGLNVLGFACYSTYNVAFYWNGTIRELYKERHGADAEISVRSNDVAFALHALLLSSVTLFQIGYYDGWRATVPSRTIAAVSAALLGVCTLYPWLIVFDVGGAGHFDWLDYLYVLSTIKLVISLIKYIPQAILNYRRKSTVGWNILQIILDFAGGTLSNLQLIFDCTDLKDFSAITGNFAKFGLGSVSILFDVIFMLQHYVLYSRNDDVADERQPLLANEGGFEA